MPRNDLFAFVIPQMGTFVLCSSSAVTVFNEVNFSLIISNYCFDL